MREWSVPEKMHSFKTKAFVENLDYCLQEPRGIAKEIAKMAGISSVHMSLLRSAKRNPSLDIAIRLSDSLGIPLCDTLNLPTSFRIMWKRNEHGILYRTRAK